MGSMGLREGLPQQAALIVRGAPPDANQHRRLFELEARGLVTQEIINALLAQAEKHYSFREVLERAQKEQVDNYLRIGFPEALGMSVSAYKNSLPLLTLADVANIPEAYTIPVLVDPRVPIGEFMRRADVKMSDRQKQYPEFLPIFFKQKGDCPYWFLARYCGKFSEEFESATVDEKYLSAHETASLVLHYPNEIMPGDAISSGEETGTVNGLPSHLIIMCSKVAGRFVMVPYCFARNAHRYLRHITDIGR